MKSVFLTRGRGPICQRGDPRLRWINANRGKNIENFLADTFATIKKIGRDAPGLEKVEEIRKFVYVKRSLGSHARDDYKTIISKSVYLYTYIEKFVYLMKTSGKIEAEAARNHLRSVMHTI